jgi:hypothetical protein
VNQQAKAQVTKMESVALPVTGQDRAVEFHVGQLGFGKRREVPAGPGMRCAEVAPAEAVTAIALVPASTPAGVRLAAQDASADHARLRSTGAGTGPDITRMGAPAPPVFSFRDPDGSNLLIVEST